MCATEKHVATGLAIAELFNLATSALRPRCQRQNLGANSFFLQDAGNIFRRRRLVARRIRCVDFD